MNQHHATDWSLFNGDSCEILPTLPDDSVDLSVFSPPFSSTYTYSPSERDLGNVADDAQFWDQFGYISRELLRVMSPSAEVMGHGPGQRVLQVGKRNVNIDAINPVGNYAVQLSFDDGHQTGLYSWDTLYDLGKHQAEHWERYLAELEAAGASR